MLSVRRRSRASNEPVKVARRHRPDYQIVLFMGLLMITGLIVIYSISPARVEFMNANSGGSLDDTHFMARQIIYLLLGLTTFVVASFIPLDLWRRYARLILMAGIASCLALSFLGLFLKGGIIINTGGAVRWFNFGFASFQPAELLKFGILLYLSAFLGRKMREQEVNNIENTLLPVGIIIAVGAVLIIVFQKDLGTGLTLLGTVVAMLYAAGLNQKLLVTALGSMAAAGVLFVVTSPHRIARILTFMNSSDTSDAASYHITQATIALGSGGFFGKGLGNGIQAFGYLPEAVNDSIFAILGETFGFIGVVLILILYAVLLRRILRVMAQTLDPMWRVFVAGVFGLIGTHVAVNVGAMTGVFPLTGVTLPFLSFGGTSLLFTMLTLGIIFAISRYTTHQDLTEKKGTPHEATMRRRGIGRPRYASPRSH